MGNPFYVLSLDGGGSKGVYSLGVLKEVEQVLSEPLHKRFALIYGASTGAIIASLLGLGEGVDDIAKRYFEMIPRIMRRWRPRERTAALRASADEVFGDRRFDAFVTDVGVVATHFERRRPMVFKSNVSQAHGLRNSFTAGFGCRIAEAVVASCAAYPYFSRTSVVTANQGSPELIDGGFVGNNPALFALADAIQAFRVPRADVRLLSIGTGQYPEAAGRVRRFIKNLGPVTFLDVTFAANTNTIEQMRKLFFSDVPSVRIDENYPDFQYATSLLESDPVKLLRLQALGRESFAAKEAAVRELLGAV